MKKLLLISLVSILLTGCSTSPVSLDKAVSVPKDRVLAHSEYNPDYAKVEIVRDSGALGGGCYLSVIFRDEHLARFDVSEKATFYLPDGEWNFAVAPDPNGKGLCSSALGFNPAFEKQIISKDKDNSFRISSRAYRRPQLFRY